MKFLATALLFVSLAACSIYPDRPPHPALHDFGPAPAVTASPGLAVSVDAPPWLRDERLRYRLLHADPTMVRFYSLDAWLAPPPALLAQRLRTAVDGSRYRLRLTLNEFEQIFDSPASAHIVLNLRAGAETSDGKPAAERLFQYTQACPTPDAKGAVSAYAAAVNVASQEIRQWLKTLP